MIKRLELTESQYIGYDKLCDERAAFDNRMLRFRQACLVELGGRLNEDWRFDEIGRFFWLNLPENNNGESNNTGATETQGAGVADTTGAG